MPLVRFEVKNEYSSGLKELYKEADREDPKAVLDGVAVAGLVGILRQLGDLAEFAAEVFHGLQEQVMTTSSRSHKLMVRVQDIEVALPPLEKAVLAQTSHLHFCYTAGSEWHPRIRKDNNHFIYNDLPRFIMDSYEECRDPPRLHMLDKFDTGGLGSCLKRYSDPTFFKRVSAISSDTNAERRKEKKARKSKRRRQRQKNGEFTRSASILSGSGRMQFTAPNDYYQPSPAQSQTVSYTDAIFKSDLRDQSFDSRAGAGFIECVFTHTSPTQLAKQDMKESSSSDLNLRSNDNRNPSYSDEIRFKYDDDQSSLQEKVVPDSSYVTWDEKTEIVEHESQNCDGDEASHMPLTDYCQYTEEFIDNMRNRDQANISLDNEKAHPIIAGSQLEDLESETDNYMDALNTIDSESENDFDYQTKREVEQYTTNFKSSGTEGKIHEIVPHESDHHPSHLESHTLPVISLNMEMSIPNIVPSERVSQDDSPHISGVTSETDSLPVNVFSESIRDGSKPDVLSSDFSLLGSKVPHRQDSTSAKVVSNTPEFSGAHSVNFWTNGGLLGLEPSKPPDFTVSNAVCHNLESGSIDNTPPSGLNAINDSLASRQLDESVGMSRKFNGSTPGHENQEDDSSIGGTPFRKLSKHLSINHGKAGDSPHNKIFDQIQGLDLGGEFKMRSTDNNPLNDGVFGLGHRLLVNGFGRKPSVLHDRTNETSKFPKSGAFENYRGLHTTSNDIGDGSSPPLELMKISFQPMKSGVERSKLKLKFHDWSQIHELARDMFPSFQLVPEPTLPPNADVSDSDDDDTFCRSSPRSDDRMSYHSQSNSEQWESSETPRSRDQEIYGTLSRISSVGSISSSHELGGKLHESIPIDNKKTIKNPYAENVVDSSHLVPLFDLLSFDAVEPSLAITSVPVESLVFSCPKEPAPPPPPLPPMQWRVLKSHSDVTKHKYNSVSDDPTRAFEMKELQSALRVERPKPDSINPQPVIASYVEQVQGRVLKSHSDVPEHKEDFVSDGPTDAFDMNELQSAIRVDRPKPDSIKHQPVIASNVEQVQLDLPFNLPKPEPIKNQQAMAFDMKHLQSAIPLEASVSTPKSKQQEQLKLNGQRATCQAVNGNGFDEKEDFLLQIRTKSFNLRRTSTEKSTVSPVPANVKVTAILEKAIAIRQAVGSDDSEVDTWSDA